MINKLLIKYTNKYNIFNYKIINTILKQKNIFMKKINFKLFFELL